MVLNPAILKSRLKRKWFLSTNRLSVGGASGLDNFNLSKIIFSDNK
jgi:hypothetical protein